MTGKYDILVIVVANDLFPIRCFPFISTAIAASDGGPLSVRFGAIPVFFAGQDRQGSEADAVFSIFSSVNG